MAVLGDAAHPMLQYFAQGACMAMEDAVAIGDSLAAHQDDVESAFNDYSHARMLRTGRVQLQSRWIGDHIYHPADVHADLRNAIMRSKTPDQWYDALQWLYGGVEYGAGQMGRTTSDVAI